VNQSADPAVGKYAATLVFISDGKAAAPLGARVDITNSPAGSGTDSFAMELVDLSKLSPLPVVDGHQVDTAEFAVLDDSGGMFNGIGLPLSPDFASSANRAFVGLHRTDAEGQVNQGYDQGFFFVVASSPVPEPQTWFAIALGIASLVSVRRLRHSKS
jgi:hypothetical protein